MKTAYRNVFAFVRHIDDTNNENQVNFRIERF